MPGRRTSQGSANLRETPPRLDAPVSPSPPHTNGYKIELIQRADEAAGAGLR